VFATVLIFLVVIFFQGFRVSIKLSNNKHTSETPYPIRLFYTSNIPIILQTALVSNMYFFSQMLFRNFKGSLLARFFGDWQETSYNGQMAPVGGLIYFITAPRTLLDAVSDPFHSIIYILFVVGSNFFNNSACALFSRTWIDVSGQGPKEVAASLKEQGMFITGGTN
jgi:protein transport protein SEC61 subunit alpha